MAGSRILSLRISFARAALHERLQRVPDQICRHRPRRVERPARLPHVSRSQQRRVAAGRWFVVEHALVHGSQLLDVEIAVDDARARRSRRARPSGRADRRRADGHYRPAHDRVADRSAIERVRLRRREEPAVEGRDAKLTGAAPGVRQPRDRLNGLPQPSIPASLQQRAHNGVEAVAVSIDRVPERKQSSGFGKQQEEHAVEHGQRLLEEHRQRRASLGCAERADEQFQSFEDAVAEVAADVNAVPARQVHGPVEKRWVAGHRLGTQECPHEELRRRLLPEHRAVELQILPRPGVAGIDESQRAAIAADAPACIGGDRLDHGRPPDALKRIAPRRDDDNDCGGAGRYMKQGGVVAIDALFD